MKNTCPLLGLDHLEFYVGNAKQAAYFYEQQFGFTPIAFRGLETGDRKAASYLLQQGHIQFVLSSGLNSENSITETVARHGDSVAVIAFTVADVHQVYKTLLQHGATAAIPPTTIETEAGQWRFAAIQGYGDVLFKFVERHHYQGIFAPGFVPSPITVPARNETGLFEIDHVVGNVETGAMDRWVNFFIRALGCQLLAHFDDKTIATKYSALMSKVVQDPTGRIKLPINEPAHGQRQSQIEEYLQFNDGPGVQHIALATRDIIHTVRQLKSAGVAFLKTPMTYYDTLEKRVGAIDQSIDELAELGILVDRDATGYLLQIFTQPVEDRPTLFFEVIERHGATSFGEGNFKALFKAIEREQARRGNLEPVGRVA
ncbi:4-hydroxyphenylpyruvate dioxygenase [Leptothoe spongobia]|uniref:4-hydroxyphenylpyruvate dioxygenase n=1 Tax=Leptothoe spongobia TAU-MAC 1115 TaxID=1967444 RepID=A0A947DDX5_9CYAN|nr:4-hydroxyphenylpyruvate dioxygenase [Leptothoe spongobia]MBT9314824.1 4-hydroxyphenylpyruvate dioxygenase [Leptothoe spongobia TAU-MAC 1115]